MITSFLPRFGQPHSGFDTDFFALGAPVGPDQPNRREDIIKVETILGNTGHHDLTATAGPLGYWGERQEKAVKTWQGESGLKVDGLLKPNGPTIASLRQAAGSLLGGLTPPSAAEVDEHHARLSQGEPGLLNTRPARLSLPKPPRPVELDETSFAFNADSARALTRSSVDGDIPKIYADFLKQAGAKAHPTVMDLIEQVNATSGRDRADRVLHGIVKGLPSEHAKALLGDAMPAPRPLGVRVADLADDETVPLFRDIVLAAFPPVPKPDPGPGTTPTGGEDPDPAPKPQPKPVPAPAPIPKPEPRPTPPIPKPEPRPNPEPEPEPRPEPDSESPEEEKKRKCDLLRAKAGNAELQMKSYEQGIAQENNKIREAQGAAQRIALEFASMGVGAARDCLSGAVKGGPWGCLREVLKGVASSIPGAWEAISTLNQGEDDERMAKISIDRYKVGIEEQKKIFEEAQSEITQNGCDRS